ncbi:MAG TPA: S8 family peptidase [Candidatus Saccharimonadales bacterium]|nr:S8 family peptidase [Candidatus Saccharimonadales bacterium]
MNNILQIKGRLEQKPHGAGGGPRNIHAGAPPVEAEHLDLLVRQMKSVLAYWENNDLLPGAIIDVEYRTVVPKSNRVHTLLAGHGKKPNDTVVGARFTDGGEKHVITHYIANLAVLEKTIEKLENAKRLLNSVDRFGGQITYEQIGQLDDSIDFESYGHSKNSFLDTVVDAYHVENFRIPQRTVDASQNSIVTIYDTGVNILELMQRLDIDIQSGRLMYNSNSTVLLTTREIEILNERAPFLVAMSVEEKTTIDSDITLDGIRPGSPITIPSPSDEPVVGVIDKAFSDQVYFNEWVEYHDMLDENLPRASDDAVHGTAVSSIIVDGPSFNPHLDDGCGRFRVRHFGVATGNNFSSFTVMRLIREIVMANPDIKVWNLSLGSDKEIGQNSISPEAAVLDELQYEFDVIFVVAGTNKSLRDGADEKLIGAPADSINSMVVNSVDASGASASYSRKGIVLSFFNKPDICTYGGDGRDFIRVCTPAGEGRKMGTSFAAPWVTRKLAYLVHVLGLSREVAKALIIDAAAEWSPQSSSSAMAPYVGHGVVPTHINDIVNSPDDEIRFIISGVSTAWDTYNYNLPVPVENGYHPFVARATLCYFPKCSIGQGVDYTNTELDLYFGRIADGRLSKYVKAINGNVQQVLSGERFTVNERDARVLYRKWDNTKRVQDKYTPRTRSKTAYGNGLWGISVKTNDRLNNNDGQGIKFGVVATLKEINGRNRIDTFIQQCQLRGWLVERLDVETQIDIYNTAQETIDLD